MPKAFPISNGMRLLGIDYGEKRVGLALSDEAGRFAYPYQIFKNSKRLAEQIAAVCFKEGVGKIILGESKDYQGRPNPVMRQLTVFKNQLATAAHLPIEWEPELLTSVEAARLPGSSQTLDAAAAAIILRNYLDRTNLKKPA